MALNVDEQGLPWSNSEGGPVLVIPAEAAHAWRGTDPPIGAVVPPGWSWGSAGGPECDYDRACDPPQKIGSPYGGFGSVDVGGRKALVLDSEIVTKWLATGEGTGTIFRQSVEEVTPDAAKVTKWKVYPGSPTIVLGDGRLFMFDSAFPGDADPEKIRASAGVGVIALGPGTYEVECGTDDDEIDYVRFRRV